MATCRCRGRGGGGGDFVIGELNETFILKITSACYDKLEVLSGGGGGGGGKRLDLSAVFNSTGSFQNLDSTL